MSWLLIVILMLIEGTLDWCGAHPLAVILLVLLVLAVGSLLAFFTAEKPEGRDE